MVATRYYLDYASPLVAATFVAEIEAAIQTLLASPTTWPGIEEPQIRRYLLKRFQGPTADTALTQNVPVPHLSEREHEALTLIVKGFSYAEAARLMGVSTHTVTTHVQNVYRKLEVHSRGEAVYEALQLGLVKLNE